jgi:hypothetical protein
MASRGTARGLHAVFLEQLRGKFDVLHHPRCRLAPNAESAQLHCRATAGYGQCALRHSLCFQVQATWFLGIRAAGHSICFATSSQLCPCRLHMSESRRTCGVRYECAMGISGSSSEPGATGSSRMPRTFPATVQLTSGFHPSPRHTELPRAHFGRLASFPLNRSDAEAEILRLSLRERERENEPPLSWGPPYKLFSARNGGLLEEAAFASTGCAVTLTGRPSPSTGPHPPLAGDSGRRFGPGRLGSDFAEAAGGGYNLNTGPGSAGVTHGIMPAGAPEGLARSASGWRASALYLTKLGE